jgi:phosphohistidine phosphatase
MNLYILRHGEAVRLGEGIRRDADRPLTPRGIADATLVGAALAKLDPGLPLLLCSPFLRARQTAESVAAQFPVPPAIEETESLSPGFRPEALVTRLRDIPPGGSVLVVGHQPDLGVFITYVIEGESPESIAMPPAALAHVKFDTDATSGASLRWLLVPDILTTLFSPR